MIQRHARCHCGDLVLRCEGEPSRVSMCHCRACQRRTGSAFSMAVFYARGQVVVEQGQTHAFERPSASGFPVTFRFCPRCGANLYWEPARMPERIGVAVGAFADPNSPAPEQSVWVEEKHHWLPLPEGMRAFEGNAPPRPAT